ncbi:hypothetical protein [Propionicicella superfundia]|uniref:hypothetical protein n=1 Tax=Propionicicella superfundia TaxID=348582 RepID=UPI000405D481|nr:hypothetical protein [Propionicicella superfundia]
MMVFIAMVLILALALGVCAVVVIGTQGAGKEKAPQIANAFAETARHLNGDAEPPESLVTLLAVRGKGDAEDADEE